LSAALVDDAVAQYPDAFHFHFAYVAGLIIETAGFGAKPTPGGVPLMTMSPGCKVTRD
jgi:hypothetical protein